MNAPENIINLPPRPQSEGFDILAIGDTPDPLGSETYPHILMSHRNQAILRVLRPRGWSVGETVFIRYLQEARFCDPKRLDWLLHNCTLIQT